MKAKPGTVGDMLASIPEKDREAMLNPLASQMTLRDYFAAQASTIAPGPTPRAIAHYAYSLADAMLEARLKPVSK